MTILVVLSGCSSPPETGLSLAEALSVDTTGFARARPGYAMQFPRDHGPHPDFYLEWWYFTGNVQSTDGDPYGYQFTIFRNALAPPAAEAGALSEWSTRQLYSAHLAISHPTGDRFMSAERIARGAAGLAGARATEEGLKVWVEDWSVDGTPDLSRVHIEAGEPDFGLSLDLRPTKPIFQQGEKGYSPKGFGDAQASHYYSITRLATEGTIQIGLDTIRVAGQSWFDREWSTSLLSEGQSGWDWFSLQLDQDQDLMYFRLRSATDNQYVDGSLVGPDGGGLPLDPARIQMRPTDYWRSPATNVEYPIAWTMSVPEHKLEMVIEAVLPNQELDTRIRYWEGSVSVSGTRGGAPMSGRGYVELTGYTP
ncbi:MAG: putative secreted hydrolase [Rhodothermales bacterium]|jgi:predicted secreted hydrolase